MAIHPDVPAGVPAEAVVVGGPDRVVHDQQVEPAVVVVVEPPRAHHPLAALEAGLLGHVLEAAAVVAVEGLAVHAAHEQVGRAVVVVVPDRGRHAVAGAPQAGGIGHVGELHSAVVAEQPIEVAGSVLLEARDRRAIGEEDIGAAVAVVVEDGYPAGHRLDQVLSGGGTVLVDEVDSGLAGDVLEEDRRDPRRRRRRPRRPRELQGREHRQHGRPRAHRGGVIGAPWP